MDNITILEKVEGKSFSILNSEIFLPENISHFKTSYQNLDGQEISDEQTKNFSESIFNTQSSLILKSKNTGKLEFILNNFGQLLSFPIIEKSSGNSKDIYIQISDTEEVLFGNEEGPRNLDEVLLELSVKLSKDLFQEPKAYYRKVSAKSFKLENYSFVKFVGLEKLEKVNLEDLLKTNEFLMVEKIKPEEGDPAEIYIITLSLDSELVYEIPLQFDEKGVFVAFLGNGYKNYVLVEIGNIQTGFKDGYDIALRTAVDMMENLIKDEAEIATMPESGLSLQRPPQLANLTSNNPIKAPAMG